MKVERKYYRWYLIGFGKYQPEVEIKNEERPEGYYWVKYLDSNTWTIAQWCGEYWKVFNDSDFLQDDSFDKIHEEAINPPKY